jgi:two-component system, NarL family, sensor kinase
MTHAAEALARRLDELAALNTVGEILNREPSFTVAAERTLERLVELLALEAGWVFVTGPAGTEGSGSALLVAATTGLPGALAADDAAALRCGGCDCHALFRSGRLDAGVNIVYCSRLAAAVGDTGGLEIHASVPMLGARGPVGIMNLAAPGRTRFDDATLTFLTAVGRQLGIAFDRAALLEARTREARYTAALEERQRVATLVHDSVAQSLFAAELTLRTALLADGRDDRIETAAGLVGEALERLRALVEVLRPMDDGIPLTVMLERLARRLSGAIDVRLDLGAGLDVDAAASGRQGAQVLYRIAQEATQNVLKHARARMLWLSLVVHDGVATLEVADDGVGGVPDGEIGPGLGLRGMRDAAAGVGGSLELRPRHGGGTVVRAEVPWSAS